MTPSRELKLVAPLLLALVLLAFGPSLGNGFVFDDHRLVERNPVIRTLDPSVHLGTPYWSRWDKTYEFYRPATTFSLAVDHALHGDRPWGYHLTNLLLHWGAALMLFLLARRLAGPLAAGIAAVLFAVHPVTTEPVAWVVGRTDVLATLLLLLALVLHAGLPDRLSRASLGRHGATVLALCGALLAKESAVVFLPAAILLDVARSRAGEAGWRDAAVLAGRRFLHHGWAYVAVVILYLVGRGAVVGQSVLEIPEIDENYGHGYIALAPTGVRLMTAVNVAARYIGLLVFPRSLSADYTFEAVPLVTSPAAPAFLVGVAVVAAAIVGLVTAARRWPAALLGAGLAAAAYLPLSHLLFPGPVVMAERVLYLPLAGVATVVAAAIVAGARRWAPGGRATVAAVVVAVLLAAPLGARARVRSIDWASDLTLFAAATRAQPRSAWAWINLGSAQLAAGNSRGALQSYREAEEIRPDWVVAMVNQAAVLRGEGRLEEAQDLLIEVFRKHPWASMPKLNLIQVLRERAGTFQATKPAVASALLDQALGLAADQADHAARRGESGEAATFLLETGRIYWAMGKPTDAAQELYEALEAARESGAGGGPVGRAPTAIQASILGDLGLLARESGRLGEAEARFTEAAEAAEAAGQRGLAAAMRINLAGVLLTSGRTEEAFQIYGQAQVLAGDQERLAQEARDGMSRILEARRQWRARTGEEPPADFTLPVAFLATAERARREGRLDEAEEVYEQLLATDPTMIAALHGRGQVRLARGDLHGAESDFVGGLATAVGRQAAVLWVGLAEVARRRGDDPGSLEALDSAVSADPSYAPARYERGLARLDARDYAGGEDDLRLAADSGRLPPAAEADASYQLGVLAFARGDADAARARLERCRALDPDHPYVERALARIGR